MLTGQGKKEEVSFAFTKISLTKLQPAEKAYMDGKTLFNNTKGKGKEKAGLADTRSQEQKINDAFKHFTTACTLDPSNFPSILTFSIM